MIAVATTALFSIIAVVVGLVLIDSFIKFYNTAKAIQRSAQAEQLTNMAEAVRGTVLSGVVTAVRITPSVPTAAARRVAKQRMAFRVKAPAARHVAA